MRLNKLQIEHLAFAVVKNLLKENLVITDTAISNTPPTA